MFVFTFVQSLSRPPPSFPRTGRAGDLCIIYTFDENIRLEIYQRLAAANSFDEIKSTQEELIDRFGKLPDEVVSLFKHIELKLMLGEKGFEKISIYKDTLEIFVNLKNEEFFTGTYFEMLMNFINTQLDDRTKIEQTRKSFSIQFKLILSDPGYSGLQKLEEILEISQKITTL